MPTQAADMVGSSAVVELTRLASGGSDRPEQLSVAYIYVKVSPPDGPVSGSPGLAPSATKVLLVQRCPPWTVSNLFQTVVDLL